MNNVITSIVLPLLFSTTGLTSALAGSAEELAVVPELDLNRYAGKWYEIARLPNRFQKMCKGDVTATYELLENGDISVVNACRDSNGEQQTAQGVARLADSSGPNSKLKVRFAPSFLSFLPFVWGDYWVIDLATDYSYAVVGSPSRDYLWILSRTPQIEETVYQQLLKGVERQGYNPDDLVKTSQSER